MKLIIEWIGDDVYAYRESAAMFKRNEPQRPGERMDVSELGKDCSLHNYSGPRHIVIDIAPVKAKKRKAAKR